VIRVLADANVLVSAALARDPEAPSVLVFEAALDGRIETLTSRHALRRPQDLAIRAKSAIL
jgi:hypothetical protein